MDLGKGVHARHAHQWRHVGRRDWVAIACRRCCSRPGRITAVGTWRRPGTSRGRRPWALGHARVVDVHTHYDGQATWDEVLAPTPGTASHARHGQLRGRLRPGSPGPPRLVDRAHGGSRGHPGTALAEGIVWDWETFPSTSMPSIDAVSPWMWRRRSPRRGACVRHGRARRQERARDARGDRAMKPS